MVGVAAMATGSRHICWAITLAGAKLIGRSGTCVERAKDVETISP